MKTIALLFAVLVPVPALASTPPQDAGVETKAFGGRRVDVSFKNGDIHNVLRLLSDAGNVNIVTAADVKGTVTIRLRNAPWDQVLDIVARKANLAYERQGTTIYVRAAK